VGQSRAERGIACHGLRTRQGNRQARRLSHRAYPNCVPVCAKRSTKRADSRMRLRSLFDGSCLNSEAGISAGHQSRTGTEKLSQKPSKRWNRSTVTPLTLALSLRERGPEIGSTGLPLPPGEGRGEGDRDTVQAQSCYDCQLCRSFETVS